MGEQLVNEPFYKKAFEELREATKPIVAKYPELSMLAIIPTWTTPSPVIPPAVVVGKSEEEERDIAKLIDLASAASATVSALQINTLKAVSDYAQLHAK